jgi:hypothetical protein
MTTTFTTTIDSMYTLPQVDGKTDVVVNAIWTVFGTDGQVAASIGGNTQFTLEQGAAFTPYSQLTQAQVIGWIPESQITSAQQCVQGQIDSILNPPVSPAAQPLPWAP